MREPAMNDRNVHPVLAELPVFAPDAELWSRIAAEHAKRRSARYPYRWIAVAATAAIAVGAYVTVPRSTQAPIANATQRESQALEREWQALAVPVQRPAADLARLHVIDAALQAAYDRGAHDDELQSLWQERNQALRGLILTASTDTVTRI